MYMVKITVKILKYILSLGCLLPILGCNSSKIIIKTRPENLTNNSAETIYQFKFPSITGNEVIDFESFKGKKIIILNVASKCGYTDQYEDWETFYAANKEKVVVLGFPSNEFLWQEKGSNDEIAQFCKLTYGVTFPMFQKTTVKGKNKNPLYQWLTTPSKNGWNKQEPVWNFCKYLIDENGKLIAFFSSKIKPDDEGFSKFIN